MADFQAEPSVERLGVLICGHGSRNRLAVEEFAQMVEQLRPKLAPMPVEHGYLEFAQPILREGLESLRQQGVTKVLAIPAITFLTLCITRQGCLHRPSLLQLVQLTARLPT